jgi:cytochrome c553
LAGRKPVAACRGKTRIIGAKPDLAAGEAKLHRRLRGLPRRRRQFRHPANPKLAQQHPEYIVKQLQEFKAGKRKNPIMQGFAAQLSDDDMRNIGAYVGSSKAKPGFAATRRWCRSARRSTAAASPTARSPPAPAATARTAPASRPSTRACPASTPTTRRAAHRFPRRRRKNSVQMTQVAAKLNDREIRAVADYIAGLRGKRGMAFRPN